MDKHPKGIAISDYDQLILNLPIAVYLCDREGRITFYNQAAVDLWGRSPEIGKDMWCGSWRIYSADGKPMDIHDCPMAVSLREDRAVTGAEVIIERPDGSRRNVLPHPKPIVNSDGEISGAINMLIDITDVKIRDSMLKDVENKYNALSNQLQEKVDERTSSLSSKMEELRRSEERYHKMIEEVRDYAILLLDTDGIILNWNKGAEKIKGYSETEIIGKNFKVFYLQEDREKNLPGRLLQEATVHGKATHEGWRLRKDGSRFWGSIVITAVHNDAGEIIGFSKVTRDLTEAKIAQDRMQYYTSELERQNLELAQYAYVASHDLQEPMRKIRNFISRIDEMEMSAPVREYLNKIDASAGRMTLLIRGLLDFAKISGGEKEFMLVDLNKIVEDIILDLELLIKDKDAVIKYCGLPVIKAISLEISQLLANLISNSLKFNKNKPEVNLSSVVVSPDEIKQYPGLDPARHYIRLSVSDNGIGIDPQYLSKIFNLYGRLHNHTEYAGTGLGLALCRKIVDNHKGYIYAETELNKGSVFHVILPAE